MRYVDMHCHLGLMRDGLACAREAEVRGIGILDASVTPAGYSASREAYAACPNVRVAAGLHPWWLSDGTCGDADVDALVELVSDTPRVGEVGLDFSTKHLPSKDAQVRAFTRVARACAEHPLDGRLLTIHAVRSADTVLDILEETGLVRESVCIFHWFSGTSDELARARRAGCWFSINAHMLATRKGREYARIVPEDRLLLETDAPPSNADYGCAELERELAYTSERLAAIRHADARELACRIAERSAALLDL